MYCEFGGCAPRLQHGEVDSEDARRHEEDDEPDQDRRDSQGLYVYGQAIPMPSNILRAALMSGERGGGGGSKRSGG